MKGYRFYLEYPDAKSKRRATRNNPDGHSGNVLAVEYNRGKGFEWERTDEPCISCVGGVYMWPNSYCITSYVHIDYLREQCLHIPESMAREIHPKLFNYLEQ